MSAGFTSDSDQSTLANGGQKSLSTQIAKRLTVTFKNVGVQVHGLGVDFGPTCWSVLADLVPFGKGKAPERHILSDISGQIRPGEMLLVVGRPGSGCTSLLKIIANNREEFVNVTGDVRYGNIGPKAAQRFRNQIVMNTEEDLHFPTLKVSEAIDFANSTKLPKTRPDHLSNADEYVSHMTEATLSSLGIQHTMNTIVGDEYVRGVSGGERKRVSLAEVIATQAPLQCWDNSTRGLDASNALDFARVLRKEATEEGKTIAATLYQAGNGIFNQFDKVIVLVEGREIYYGPTSEAKNYFEEMGFKCAPGANVADFLTSVAVHTERTVLPGFEGRVPNSAEDFEKTYKNSELFQRMIREMSSCTEQSLASEIEDLNSSWTGEKNRSVSMFSRENSPYHVSFTKQVWACTKRQFQILNGDRLSNILQVASALILALVTGSNMYNLSNTSASTFMRPGALFCPILFWTMNKMSETTASFMGRRIISRQKRLAFNRPGAYALACVITDIPIVIAFYTLFHIVFYFMVNFQVHADYFFTNWFIVITLTLCVTSLYRMIGAWCKHFGLAAQISGLVTMVMMVYAGYLIPINQLERRPWFRWMAYLNPATYAFEAVMGTEYRNLVLDCVEPQYVPFGPTYNDDQYRSCTIAGTSPGNSVIYGNEYLETQYSYSEHHVWRNVGIIIGFWVFFACMAGLGFEMTIHSDSGSRVLYDRGSTEKDATRDIDEEKADLPHPPTEDDYANASKTTFTFENISYFVQHEGKEKQLLQEISGYVEPGQLVALMGSSGAGKTTLMDVLAQRKDSGRIEGSILVNGKPQGISFQRSTGYCEQNDVHEPTATVWESLIFSARLRQNHQIPDKEKQEYVRRIMDLLELTPLQHAIVGTPGSGLSIEQRKRLTLATELVAKPSLIFLDEPTSGLDGQSAYEICRFMRKLAASGQTIICTIHQPSATLFNAFDVLLLLARGGRTTYFGPTGADSATVIDYFAQRGAICPPDTNPAEFIVDVVQGRFQAEIDWPQQWLDSAEMEKSKAKLQELNKSAILDSQPTDTVDETDTRSFASPLLYQVKFVTRRQLIALWRNPDYIWNKICLHVTNALFGGFTFWMIGDGTFDLQLRLMAVFNFLFVAPGCINQLQPLFIQNRDLFETREKKSKTYHWFAFVAAQLIAEVPVLIICATVYFICWYFPAGLPIESYASGQVYLQMLLYEFLYTSIGQAIAAYSPNAYFAALANPIILGAALIGFCGVVVPYSQIQVFWRYWLYYLDPFTYLIGGLLEPVVWDVEVHCKESELTYIPLPSATTCGEYMSDFFSSNAGYVVDQGNSTMCAYCPYSTGADYLRTMNINERYYGWRDVGITALFCISSYALVFLMMKLRTKATKTAS